MSRSDFCVLQEYVHGGYEHEHVKIVHGIAVVLSRAESRSFDRNDGRES